MRTRQEAEPSRLDESDLQAAVQRQWAQGLASDGAARPDVRRLARAVVLSLDEVDRLRRAGRDVAAAREAVAVLLDGLRKRGCVPPAAI